MQFGKRARKSLLTVHVVSSVGWLGAVAAFFAVSAAALADATDFANTYYVPMQVIARWIIVPFALASLATGILVAAATPWGLFRHYWIIFKLAINVVATLLLLLHLQPIDSLAEAARNMAATAPEMTRLRLQLVVNSGIAVVALVVAVILAVVKPRGTTPWSRSRRAAA